MQERNAKSSLGGPTEYTEKGFSLLRTDTIQLWSLLEDCAPLDENSLKSLSEDVSYRVREITDSAVNYMHHCRRNQLKTSDMNRAFQMANIEKTFGYISKEPFEYNTVRVDDLDDKLLSQFKTTLYELKDETVELKLPDEDHVKSETESSRMSSLQANWHTFNTPIKLESTSNLINTDETLTDKVDADLVSSQLPDPFNKYYTRCTMAILGSDEDEVYRLVLNDLRTNNKIQPVLPFYVSFFSQAIQKLTSTSRNQNSIDRVDNIDYVCRVLSSMRCVVSNPNLFLASKSIFSKVISCLLFCAIQNTTFVDDLSSLVVREQAASILVLFLRMYQRFSIRTVKYLTEVYFAPNLISQLDDHVSQSHMHTVYGVLCLLNRFGSQMIENFLPTIARIVAKIQSKPKPTIMETIILNMCLFKSVARSCMKKKKHSNASAVYRTNTRLFGDAFSNQTMAYVACQSLGDVSKISRIEVDEIDRLVRTKSFKYLDFVRENPVITAARSDWFDVFDLKPRPGEIKINYGVGRKLATKTPSNQATIYRSCQSNSILIGRVKLISNKNKFEYAVHLNDRLL